MDNVVVDLRMKAGWNSLQLDWTLPDIYRNCVSEYVVQVCSTDCLDKVTVHGMTYSVSNLSVCTLYSGSVVVKLPDTRLSTRNATVSLLTRSAESEKSQLFSAVKITTTTVEFEWHESLKMPSACAKKFVLSTLSTNGSIISKQNLNYSHRNYTVLDLKPCQSYSFELKLVDEHGSSTIDYNAVNVVTEASDLMSVSNLELDRVSLYSLYLKWFLPEESSACVSNYTVTFLTADNSTMETITPNKYITWTGEIPSQPKNVTVTAISSSEVRVPMGSSRPDEWNTQQLHCCTTEPHIEVQGSTRLPAANPPASTGGGERKLR
ncbi:uncharacterized protein LOC124373417 [Homalodisca vitripennis]|uniref:uncharacterized protein LOC124373417 n=1 Tax=Homalodisca vitripennis TaxID=197043 RepID=UPI001EEAD9C0|nr:uncharacterized protein LOC124373417 [Homalodisca vitripennis]